MSGDLRGWIAGADESHALGPGGAKLSRLPMLDWSLLEPGSAAMSVERAGPSAL